MPLVQLNNADKSWPRLKAGWREQCRAANEDFDQYAQGTFIVLNQLADSPERRAGIYAVQRGDEIADVICQANTTPLPGSSGTRAACQNGHSLPSHRFWNLRSIAVY
jgi:hypothetical protein